MVEEEEEETKRLCQP